MKFKFLISAALVSGVLVFNSCKKPTDLPAQTFPFGVVSTSGVTNLGETTAESGGTVSSEGTSALTAVGICWDTDPMPTTLKQHSYDGAGVGTFKSLLNGLEPDTKYYVRSYATNALGTKYGEEVSFKTLPKWITLLPTGFNRNISDILIENATIYLAASGMDNGVKKSTDNGVSFTNANTGLDPNDDDVYSLFSTGSSLLAGTSAGVYVSVNGGDNWNISNLGIVNNDLIYQMVSTGQKIFASSFSTLYISSDNGATWAASTPTISGFSPIRDMATMGQTIFVATSGKIIVSSNNGSTWRMLAGGLPLSMSVDALHVKGSNIYAATNQGLFVSSNNGDDWTLINTIASSFVITSMAHVVSD